MLSIKIAFWLSLSVLSDFCSATPKASNEEWHAPANPAALGPDHDPFYKAPPGYESAPLGAILRSRPVPNPITLNNVTPLKPKAAWQIQYRTQNSVGEPEANVVTLLVPHNAKKNSHFVYSFFSDAAYNGCNPSVTIQTGAPQDNLFNQLQMAIVIQALNSGYYVSFADDGGFQAAFAAGPHSAYATLDSIRAVHQSGNFSGIERHPITTLHGYSNGAMTVGWSTELHPTYAPELNIAGAALGGLIPNITALTLLDTFITGPRARFGPTVVLGITHDYKELAKWLDDNLVPDKAAIYRKPESQCFDSNEMFAFMNLNQFYKRGYTSLRDPIPAKVLREAGTMGERGTPKIPWYLYETVGDDASPIALTDQLMEKHCKNGADIYYERNPMKSLDHRWECIFGMPGAFEWMNDRHKGIPAQKGCKTELMSPQSLYGWSESLLYRGVLSSILAWMGNDIGPKSPTNS